ncbi:MAG: V-type ATPase subunit [Clostridia bacterium]|nr:V-type ATPase subunit [Clostridia bacterium]
MALKDTEYMYISARIKAREGQTTYYARVKSYLDAKSLLDLCAISGVTLDGESEREALENHFDKRVREAFELVKEGAPEPKYFDFLLYEYDACNLKVLIKGSIRKMSVDGMLYEIGTVDAKALKEALEARRLEGVLPSNMVRAVDEAYEAYSRTGDARVIDLIIDKACFADMLENSRLCGCDLAQALIKLRIDSINISTLQRILKSEIADKISTFNMAFIDGGEIAYERLERVLSDEEYSLIDALEGSELRDTIRSLGNEYSFSRLERALDMKYMSLIDEVKYVPFGVEVVCSYLVNTLYEAKNARIIIAGLAMGLDEDKIRERVRI